MLNIDQSRLTIKQFFLTGKQEHLQRKSVIVPYDTKPEYSYLVVEGYVKVVSHSSKGSERIHYLYGPGDFFSVSLLFEKRMPRIEFVAFTDVKLMKKTMTDTKKFFNSEPSSLLAILYQQTSTYTRIINLNMGSAEHRVAYRLQTLCQRFGKQVDEHSVIEIPITLQDIANMVRLTRESTGKIMVDLERKGCIHFGRRNIVVYPKRLSQFTEE